VRAMALAEKECDGAVAERWIAKIDPEVGTSVLCTKEGAEEDDAPTLISSFPWESPSNITLAQVDTLPNDQNSSTWDSLQQQLQISIFPGGTQARIGNEDEYDQKWARIKINSEEAGKESTICFSCIANYPFLSSGECTE
jgi:hypothetical protein